MKTIALLLSASLLSVLAHAEPIIRCEPETGGAATEPITIELNAVKKFGTMLHCVDGASPGDMEPCAPTGGWGLSYPTGTAELYGIARRWQDLATHTGGMTFAAVSNVKISFEGAFRWSDGTEHDRWRFTVDRTSGIGEFAVQDGDDRPLRLKARYGCRGVKRRF